MSAGGAPLGRPDPWPAPGKLNLFLHVVGRRLDGYHHDNEAGWAPGNTRDKLAFLSKAGAVSTAFDTFRAADGVMRFEGRFAFDPAKTHVLEETGPGWAIGSSYVSWVPRPRLGIWSAVFPTPSPVTAISTVGGGTRLYLVGLDEGHGGGRVWSKFFPDPENPTQWTGCRRDRRRQPGVHAGGPGGMGGQPPRQ